MSFDVLLVFFFFFFKQKTAYEMRISDWSSDVCSSDLPVPRPGLVEGVTPREDGRIDLIGLPKKRIAELFETAGLDTKAAKLRAKQIGRASCRERVCQYV